jgi:hypothetical protein
MDRINGVRLKQWRDDAGYSQETFAELLRCGVRTIRNAETLGKMTTQLVDAACAELNRPKEELLRLKPELRVAFLDGIDQAQDDLFDSARQCHQQLFSGPRSAISRQNAKQWLGESHLWKRSGTPWREIYAVAYEDQPHDRNVVGLLTMSGHTDWEFWYCTHIGVLPPWRNGLFTEELLFDAVEKRIKSLLPKAVTVLWESPPIASALLKDVRQHVNAGGKISDRPDKDAILQALRNARRLELFDWVHSLIAMTPAKQPLVMSSAAWQEPLTSQNERQTMVLIHPLDGNLARPQPPVSRTLDFIFNNLYADSFGGGVTPFDLRNYRPYVNALKERAQLAATGCKWALIPRFDDLVTQAKLEGLRDELSLPEADK